MTDPARTRTITWTDPAASERHIAAAPGLEVLQRVIAGELPNSPMAQLMGITLVDATAGGAVFTATPGEYHYNPAGVAHGGFAATLLDSAMGCAAYTTMPAGVNYTTVELKVSLMRPMTVATGEVRATGRVLHRGRRTIVADGRIEDAAGRLIAHGTTTLLVSEP